jgi:hypothetical protein
MFQLYANVISAIQVPATVWKVGKAPILKRYLLNMFISALRSHQIFKSGGRVWIVWLAKSACEKYLQAPIELNMGIQWHKEMRGIEAQIRCITCRPHIWMPFHTSLMVLGLTIKYCTFLFEFTNKYTFPQFKPLMTYKSLRQPLGLSLCCQRIFMPLLPTKM